MRMSISVPEVRCASLGAPGRSCALAAPFRVLPWALAGAARGSRGRLPAPHGDCSEDSPKASSLWPHGRLGSAGSNRGALGARGHALALPTGKTERHGYALLHRAPAPHGRARRGSRYSRHSHSPPGYRLQCGPGPRSAIVRPARWSSLLEASTLRQRGWSPAFGQRSAAPAFRCQAGPGQPP